MTVVYWILSVCCGLALSWTVVQIRRASKSWSLTFLGVIIVLAMAGLALNVILNHK